MKYYSTADRSSAVGAREAVLSGLAQDGGLYMPEHFPQFSKEFLESLHRFDLADLGTELLYPFFSEELSQEQLADLCRAAFSFDAPLVRLSRDTYALELFHGPTLAFKDFGARFMARLFSHYMRNESRALTVLVATSGDTGSAVAAGFFEVPGIEVVLLYPSGKVSPLQEKQLTGFGKNIRAIEVAGTFDDCQKLVKAAFRDTEIRKRILITSANSINISRLLPQALYYISTFGKLYPTDQRVLFSVPSGNFGNICAGLFAQRMGLRGSSFVAATNANAVVPEYLKKGRFEPRPSVQTISNAMDVGNPSNLVRIQALFEGDPHKIAAAMPAYAFSDQYTREAIKEIYERYGYIADPHGAVAYLGLKMYNVKNSTHIGPRVFLETAHPAKFREIVEDVLGQPCFIPDRLARFMRMEKHAIQMGCSFETFKSYLLSSVAGP